MKCAWHWTDQMAVTLSQPYGVFTDLNKEDFIHKWSQHATKYRAMSLNPWAMHYIKGWGMFFICWICRIASALCYYCHSRNTIWTLAALWSAAEKSPHSWRTEGHLSNNENRWIIRRVLFLCTNVHSDILIELCVATVPLIHPPVLNQFSSRDPTCNELSRLSAFDWPVEHSPSDKKWD